MVGRRIRRFNVERNMIDTWSSKVEYENLLEELNEFREACIEDDEHEIIDALADICVFAIGAMYKRGYSFEDCMDEVLQEIESREQNPIQKEEWEKHGANGRKWLKDKNQDPATLYKADYSKCKYRCVEVFDV